VTLDFTHQLTDFFSNWWDYWSPILFIEWVFTCLWMMTQLIC